MVFDIMTTVMGILTLAFVCNAVYTLLTNVGFLKSLEEGAAPLLSKLEGEAIPDVLSKTIEEALDTVVKEAISTTFDKRNNFLVPESQAFEHLVMGGQVLLLLWLAYVGTIAFTMCSIATPRLNAEDRLKRLFRDLKHSFLVFVFAVFFAEMIHPDFGFIDAQIDLTLLTIAIPAMHVTLGMCVQNAMQSSR